LIGLFRRDLVVASSDVKPDQLCHVKMKGKEVKKNKGEKRMEGAKKLGPVRGQLLKSVGASSKTCAEVANLEEHQICSLSGVLHPLQV